MNEACDCIEQCGFFRKFGERRSNVWRGLVSFYCQGKGFHLCERRKRNNDRLGDDVMPTGQEVSRAFLTLG